MDPYMNFSIFMDNITNNVDNATDDVVDVGMSTIEKYCVSILAGIVILSSVFGNALVIFAVVAERRLRRIGNVYIVSLAISDLFVGSVITPIALAYAIAGVWPFEKVFCDIWVCMDVICCTSSIINLCVISFDRYNAITMPLQYALKRTPKRALVFILFVWGYSVIIAIPPFVGWNELDISYVRDTCAVSQDKGYTLYSTIGSFYLPLIVMMLLYWRVYSATKNRKKQWIPAPGSSQMVLSHRSSFVRKSELFHAKDKPVLATNHVRPLTQTINPHIGQRLKQNGEHDILGSVENLIRFQRSTESHSTSAQSPPLHDSVSPVTAEMPTSIGKPRGILSRMISVQSSSCTTDTTLTSGNEHIVEVLENDRTIALAPNTRCSLPISRISRPALLHAPHGNAIAALCRSLSPLLLRKPGEDSSEERDSSDNETHTKVRLVIDRAVIMTRRKKRKNRISLAQEQRAARTLGVIMGCFVACWLPFFLVTLIKPFCSSDAIHPVFANLVLWLGYMNSGLNPIIYTFFNRDFKCAFKRMFRCSSETDLRRRYGQSNYQFALVR